MLKVQRHITRFIFRITLSLFFSLFFLSVINATHNRAGEIRIEQTGPLTIRATVVTYTRASSVDADRDSLTINWGDGTTSTVSRNNGFGGGEILGNDIKYNTYTGDHTYSGRGTFTISMTDPNRIAGILNVDPPHSVEIPFHLQTVFTLLNTQFEGYNNSVILLQPPIDVACVGQRFIHIPSAYDPDGDSIAYELTIPMMAPGTIVPNYSLPNQIRPGADNVISFNEITGEFIWDSPQVAGEYNIAFYIKEYRDGKLITKTMRDMQILVEKCDNRPPEFQLPEEICVFAGEVIEIPITVTDPDIPNQLVKLMASGGPMERGATLDVDDQYHSQPLHATFRWATSCNDISRQYYSLVVKAEDNGIYSGAGGREPRGLSTLKILRIKVIGPPPGNEDIEIVQNAVKLSWDSPYSCEITENQYFKGFTIWRSEGSRHLTIDTCNFIAESMGYEPIAFNIRDKEGSRYTYTDQATNPGNTYCYRITAEFSLMTPSGNPYNIVESLPTGELCIVLNRDLPALQNVSIINTDDNDGEVYLRWLKPDPETLDTILNRGPYAFSVQRSPGVATDNFVDVPGSLTAFNDFISLIDTTFVDKGINTVEQGYTYRIALYTEGKDDIPYGYSAPATSVFAEVHSTDRTNILFWKEVVPWYNFEYKIYKRNDSSGEYELIDSTRERTYTDTNLLNDHEYCYYVETKGSYGVPALQDTLFNLSQIRCGTPIDTIPPCPPEFVINNVCNSESGFSYEDLFNEIAWEFTSSCQRAPDIAYIRIYFKVDSTGSHNLIAEVPVDDMKFRHAPGKGLDGCYSISAVDFSGNESKLRDFICVKNCPFYSLPNTFTPNGDGYNDVFKPRKSRFIERINFKVYNRWGNHVFSTTEPEINWDGRNFSGELVSPGTYYYICDVYQFGIPDQPLSSLKGYIEIIY